MEGYRRAAHTVHLLYYHFVFSAKYRKPVLRGDIAIEVRDLIREICRANEIDILRAHVRPDHVHRLLEVPPHLAPSRVMQAIKGKTSHHLLMDAESCARRSGSAPVGAWPLRCDERPCDRRNGRRVYSAPRGRAPRRGALSNHRVANPASCGAGPLVDFSRR
jgi:REP element-mobilizing transposase RayT